MSARRIAALALLSACGGRPEPLDPVFVRGGVVLPAASGVTGRALAGDRVLVPTAWSPGERVHGAVAPAMAECVPLFSVPLGDVSRLVAMGGTAPDTSTAFSPDGAALAIGAYTGEIVVVDAFTGREIARRRLPEALVKQVSWAPDGRTLYAAEQSPDALVHALDPADLSSRWTLRLADHVGTSAPPPGDDLYGVYTLPFASGLDVLDGGDLLVSAVHGWDDDDGVRRNASRLLRVAPDGTVRAAWPTDGSADATFKVPRIDREGGLVAVPIGRSAQGPPPELPVDGVQVLALDGLAPRGAFVAEPLAPHFSSVFLWESVDVDAARDTLLMGHADGRVQLWPLSGGSPRQVDLGTPVTAGDVPISASIGHAVLAGDHAVSITSRTNIPYGAAAPELRPPSAHPNENAVWAHALDGTLSWTWRGPHVPQGLTVRGDTLIVGAGERGTDDRTDLFGALVFDLSGEGSGAERLRAFCGTAQPVFFRHAVADDGRIAVAEVPTEPGDPYRVTVLR